MPANYSSGVFETCKGDSTYFAGLYSVSLADGSASTSTFRQGQPNTPQAHQAAPSSECQYISTVSNKPADPFTSTYFSSSPNAAQTTAAAAATTAARGTTQNNTNAASLTSQAVLSVIGLVTGLVVTLLAQ